MSVSHFVKTIINEFPLMNQVLIKEFPSKKSFEFVPAISVSKLDKNNPVIENDDHYQILWMESGVRSLSVDFQTLVCYPYSILFLLPGVKANLKFACELPQGWVVEFSREFFVESYLNGFNIKNVELFYASGEIPVIVLSPKIGQRINSLAEMIAEVMQSQIPNRELAAASLLKTMLVYCDSKCNIRIKNNSNNHYLNIVSSFKHLVSQNYHAIHQVSEYAGMLHITPKYLNQVVKDVMGVTAKSVIQEQLIIQACRDLKFSNLSIKEISIQLGFSEPEHFSNFFKKNIGCSPMAYRQK
jgi:AraC family transcriptional regulator, transcriptional activator of pobA